MYCKIFKKQLPFYYFGYFVELTYPCLVLTAEIVRTILIKKNGTEIISYADNI